MQVDSSVSAETYRTQDVPYTCQARHEPSRRESGGSRLQGCCLRLFPAQVSPQSRVKGSKSMLAVIRNVTFDCPDARALASFYAEFVMMPIRHLDTPEQGRHRK